MRQRSSSQPKSLHQRFSLTAAWEGAEGREGKDWGRGGMGGEKYLGAIYLDVRAICFPVTEEVGVADNEIHICTGIGS